MNYAVHIPVAETTLPDTLETLENSLCLDRELFVDDRSELSPVEISGETILEGDHFIRMCESETDFDETGYEDGLRSTTVIQELVEGVFREQVAEDRLVLFWHRCVHESQEDTIGPCSWELGHAPDDWSAFPRRVRRRWGSYRPTKP